MNNDKFNGLLVRALNLAWNLGLEDKTFALIREKSGSHGTIGFHMFGDCFFSCYISDSGDIVTKDTIQENTPSAINKLALTNICHYLSAGKYVVLG